MIAGIDEAFYTDSTLKVHYCAPADYADSHPLRSLNPGQCSADGFVQARFRRFRRDRRQRAVEIETQGSRSHFCPAKDFSQYFFQRAQHNLDPRRGLPKRRSVFVQQYFYQFRQCLRSLVVSGEYAMGWLFCDLPTLEFVPDSGSEGSGERSITVTLGAV